MSDIDSPVLMAHMRDLMTEIRNLREEIRQLRLTLQQAKQEQNPPTK